MFARWPISASSSAIPLWLKSRALTEQLIVEMNHLSDLRIKGLNFPLWISAIANSITALGIITLFIGIALVGNKISQTVNSVNASLNPDVPERAYIISSSEEHNWVYVAINEKYLYEMSNANHKTDQLKRMERLGKIFLVESGTEMLIIDKTYDFVKVQILSGSQYGRMAYVRPGWIEQ